MSSSEPAWDPPHALIDSARLCLAHAPRDTPADRFEAWAWRALLDEDGPGLLTRHAAPSHLTASAIILSPDARRTCLVLHNKLNRWVQPGGHLEPGDQTMAGAAAREALEETGLRCDVLPNPVILFRHLAPCRPGVVDWHLDVQFAAVSHELVPLVSDESQDVRWFDVDDLPSDTAPGLANAALPRAIAAIQRAAFTRPSP